MDGCADDAAISRDGVGSRGGQTWDDAEMRGAGQLDGVVLGLLSVLLQSGGRYAGRAKEGLALLGSSTRDSYRLSSRPAIFSR